MITSISNSRVKQVAQWQAKARERRSAGIYIVEGFKMFEEAFLEEIQEVYLSSEVFEDLMNPQTVSDFPGEDCAAGKASQRKFLKEKLDQTGFQVVAREVFRRMSDTQSPQGILCVMKRKEYRLEQMAGRKALLMVLENLQDPGNLGTIVRTAEGAGVTGVILGGGTVDIYNPKTIRATMGSIYRVPFVYVEDLGRSVDWLRGKGVRTYAAHLQGEKTYDGFSYTGSTAFLVGNEGNGLSEELTARADEYVKIPMSGQVESLNAAVAAALLMYEARRQRNF